MKSEASQIKTMSSKQLLVKQMVEKKRKLFFQDKQKQKKQEVPAPIKVPILKECHFGKMTLWRVEHFWTLFVFTFGHDY